MRGRANQNPSLHDHSPLCDFESHDILAPPKIASFRVHKDAYA